MAEIEQICVLPYSKVIRIACRGLSIRLVKTMLVTACIALAIAFLAYFLCANGLTAQLQERGSPSLLRQLAKEGVLEQIQGSAEGAEDRAVQARWMVGIALLISFVGIVNAMLISVTERFREIGTMKCLGALDSFIVKLYLIESLFQGLVGTVAGVVIGVTLAYIQGLNSFGAEVWHLLPLGGFVKIVSGSLLAGILMTIGGALYPAWRAAKMEPVEAMRTEV